jgi:hypothetical protein
MVVVVVYDARGRWEVADVGAAVKSSPSGWGLESSAKQPLLTKALAACRAIT